MQLLMFFAEEHPANLSQSPDLEEDWMTLVATSCLPSLQLLNDIGPVGWSGKTSPAYSPPTKEGTLAPSSEGWQSAGMGSRTGCLTLNISAWHSAASVSSLSDILETGTLPQRYFLSAQACQGILRRAQNQGKKLPPSLVRALKAVAFR